MENINILPHIASRILNIPLMITPQGLDVIVRALALRIGIVGIEPQAITDFSVPKKYRNERNEDGIALIPIYDTLVYRQYGSVQPISSHLTSYEEIWKWYDEANSDSSIHTILFDIDSNGGEVSGVFDTIDHVSSTKQKQVIAMINESAYSAAFGIASAADKIYLPRTGGAGSVGVIALHIDQSLANEKEGLKYTPIFAGARKYDFSPNQPLSEEAFRIAKEQVDEIYGLFVKTVSINRKMTQKAVKETEAGIFQGQKAVDIGFADGVKSFSEVIQMIKNNHKKGAKKMAMAIEEKPVEQVQQTVQPVIDVEKVRAEAAENAKKEAREAEQKRIHGIRQACFAVKHLIGDSLMDSFISEGVSLVEANQRIIEHLAKGQENQKVQSTVGALSTGQHGESLIENAKKRQAEAGQRGPLV